MNPDYYSRRVDFATAAIINQGISYQDKYGTSSAATYLYSNGVDIDVAIRVLSRPWERRKQ